MSEKRSQPQILFIALIVLLILSFTPGTGLAQDGFPPSGDCKDATCQPKKPITYRAEPFALTGSGGPDQYGYTWSDGYTFSSWSNAWTDAKTSGTQIAFGTKEEDDIVVAVNLPFGFKFYEKTYTSINISSNGIIGFDDTLSEERPSYVNLPIPHDYLPDAFLAPYWSDLTYPYIYTASGTDGRGQFFVVEWYNCQSFSQAGSNLTFEAKLYANGDIAFLYNQLTNPPDPKTIGLEEPDATYGLMVLYNAAGPNENQAIVFTRPGASRRVKTFPSYQSQLMTGRDSVFPVKLRNTGDLGPQTADTINIQIDQTDPRWIVDLLNGDGFSPLVNSDSNPLPDTGSLAAGGTFNLLVKVNAPSDLASGETLTVTLTASSSKNPASTDTALLKTAIPEPFVYIYRNAKLGEQAGVNVELVSPGYRLANLINPNYTGASFMLHGFTGNRFLTLWENNISGITTYLDYNGVLGNGLSQTKLPKHLTSNVPCRDQSPSAAQTPNGRIGVAWIRTETNAMTGQYVQNVFFSILDSDASNPVINPFSVTGDNSTHPSSQFFAYREVTVAATDNNNFHLSWVQYHPQGAVVTEDLAYAVYNSNGGQVRAKSFLTVQAEGVNYSNPAMVPYVAGANQRLLALANQRLNPANPVYEIVATVLDGVGNSVTGQTELYSQRASELDGVQLGNGNLAIAWVNQDTQKVNYAFLGSDLSKPTQPNVLSNPDDLTGGRSSGRVSVTKGGSSGAVLTWMDSSFQERLYYALVSGNGPAGIVTRPVILRALQKGVETTIETRAGFGNADYTSIYLLMLPIGRK